MIHIIIVTYNSQTYIDDCISSIQKSIYKKFHIYILDNNSVDTSYLNKYERSSNITLYKLDKNYGFSKANNLGFLYSRINHTSNSDIVLFLNPDTILFRNTLANLYSFHSKSKKDYGYTGKGIRKDGHSGFVYDSTGLKTTFYGRFYDRGSNKKTTSVSYNNTDYGIKGICGAFFALSLKTCKLLLNNNGYIFNEKIFMYKEDIELSLRLRLLGVKLVYVPTIVYIHKRGWKRRKHISKLTKIMAAKNDKYLIPYTKNIFAIIFYFIKPLIVKLLP